MSEKQCWGCVHYDYEHKDKMGFAFCKIKKMKMHHLDTCKNYIMETTPIIKPEELEGGWEEE